MSLNWLMCKEVIPIPGARTPEQVSPGPRAILLLSLTNLTRPLTHELQARENCGAMGWKLSTAEVLQLDELSSSFKQFPGMPLEVL